MQESVDIESLCRDSRSSDIHCRQDNRLDHADARLQHSPIDYLSWAEGIEIGFAFAVWSHHARTVHHCHAAVHDVLLLSKNDM